MIHTISTNHVISDRPILEAKDDELQIEQRFVNDIFNAVNDGAIEEMTVAITGEWGSGKSSVINLLRKKISGTRKVVNFEPLVEGRFEIVEIIELFYLKLYKVVSDNVVKDVLKKCLKSAALLSRIKFTGGISVPLIPTVLNGEAKIEYDLAKHIDDILDLWRKEEPDEFSAQAKNLNDVLKSKGIKLCVIIDEIDRLPAGYIINFLLFCRTLESFDNMICIVGIDYEQVISKLIKESSHNLGDYSLAVNYVDKLFQAKYPIHHGINERIEFTKKIAKKADISDVLDIFLNAHDYNITHRFLQIISYLSTPRQIKKWLISVKLNLQIISSSATHKINFLEFIAATIKHPILSDYLSKYGLEFLKEKMFALKFFVTKKYGVDFNMADGSSGIKDEEIVLAGMGLHYGEKQQEKFKKFLEILRVQHIKDEQAKSYVKDFIKIPLHFIALFVEGCARKETIKLYSLFFSNDIDKALEFFLKNNSNIDILLHDIANALYNKKYTIPEKWTPPIELLNRLWVEKVREHEFSYRTIILFCAQSLPLEKVICNGSIGLSGYIIYALLETGSPKIEARKYNLEKFRITSESLMQAPNLQNIRFKENDIKQFDQNIIKEIIMCWLERIENAFSTDMKELCQEPTIMNIFYLYVQIGWCIDCDKRSRLSNSVMEFLKNKKISPNMTQSIIDKIKKEKVKFEANTPFIKDNPMEILFNNDPEMISLMSIDSMELAGANE